uniref:Zinc finger protein RFP-like n=1 Tax=Sphenodon punctatus TaxID=8508 RepID=A0A8D0G7A9_SPHPU
MAAAAGAGLDPVKGLQEETTCSTALDYFLNLDCVRNELTTDCGHNFCRACVTQSWGESVANVSFPQCREICPRSGLKPNRQLRNVVYWVKQFILTQRAGLVCEKHQEPLKLFCQDDHVPICLVCEKSKGHRAHTVVPIEEAVQEYKEKLSNHLETLQKDRDEVLALKLSRGKKSQELLEAVGAKRKKALSEFERLHQFLEEQQSLLLARLGELETEIGKRRGEDAARCSEEISRLDTLIREMEGQFQQPASQFLQDVESTLSRSKKRRWLQEPVDNSPELEDTLRNFSLQTADLQETLQKFQESLPSEIEKAPYRTATVTLDPDTANPELVLSEDWKSVRWGETRQNLPDNPERFVPWRCVLGSEGFTWGRHCWEVEVGCGGDWSVGVARESVRRKGVFNLRPEGGIWAVGLVGGQYKALTARDTPLSLSSPPRRIRVCLDCVWGWVTFLDADTEAPIFTFPPASFSGERIRPWLYVMWRGSQLRMCP